MKQAVTLLIDNVDKWIISEQEKELGEASVQQSTSQSASVSNGTSASPSAPSSASVNRLLGEVRSSADFLMTVKNSSDDDDNTTEDESFAELSKKCALALNDLVIAAKRLNLTADAVWKFCVIELIVLIDFIIKSALREANFLFLAGAKLFYQ